MVGRVYRWRGEHWRVIARWLPPAECSPTYVCDTCGDLHHGVGCRGSIGMHGSCCIPSSQWTDGQYTHRRIGVGPRNVLLENVETGQRTVRPFRGLRKITI